MRRICLLIIAIIGMAVTSVSCLDDATVGIYGYVYGIDQFEGTESDMSRIEKYLKSRKCLLGAQAYTGVDIKDTDRKAKTQFSKAAANLSQGEISGLGLSPGCRFRYYLSRRADTDDPDSENIVIDSFSYPDL